MRHYLFLNKFKNIIDRRKDGLNIYVYLRANIFKTERDLRLIIKHYPWKINVIAIKNDKSYNHVNIIIRKGILEFT